MRIPVILKGYRYQALFLALFLTLFLLAVCSFAQPTPAPTPLPLSLPDLGQFQESSFPEYAKPAYRAYLTGDFDSSLAQIAKVENNIRLEKRERAILLKGIIYLKQPNIPEAQSALKAALAVRGSDSDILFLYALAQRAAGQTDQSLATMEEALWFSKFSTVQPQQVLLEINRTQKALNNPEKANAALDRALAKDPSSVLIKNSMARAKIDSGAKTEAIRLAREALAADPASVDSRLLLAEALLQNADPSINGNQIEEAQKLAAAVCDTPQVEHSKCVQGTALQVKAMSKMGNLEQAKKVLSKALKQDSNNQVLKNLEAQLKVQASS